MRVRWLKSSLTSLQSSLRLVHDENPALARDLAQRIQSTVARLEQFPLSGRTGATAGTREIVNARLPFIVVYRIVDNEVQILRVFHDRQCRPPR